MLAFQPHRYTRTRDCFEDFVQVLSQADAVLLAEVYAAGEEPIQAADGRALARGLRVAGKVEPLFVADIAQMPSTIVDNARPGDVVLTMGAGSIGARASQSSTAARKRQARDAYWTWVMTQNNRKINTRPLSVKWRCCWVDALRSARSR